ncbi:TonB-dependent receptor [Microbulbifer sp. OS29]|uniref:TonB-dependent receptor n=1 Tax=Microbulbifer okhotskensis TaxID=2926617 RepID=A0A9X2ET79_9GAMM|nr:TonB-dependent receptor [Microbulbifer okhotskensis]MCO1335133.1 TonB-dependent receptor [Microbulbifer okhotskensis]
MKLSLFPRLLLSAAIISAASTAQISHAQETAAGIRGSITGSSGQAITDAKVTVVHTPSNSRREVKVSEAGQFNLSGLRVGGPYTVTIESEQGERVLEDIYLSVGDTLPLSLTFDSSSLEEVSVLGQALSTSRLAVGPSSHFNSDDLASTPSVNRDIKDLLRLDPRVYIDEANLDAIQCAGANPRFNSLTVDGVRMNDNFGLNSNGYPTERMPFSYDAIDHVAVELAPFDVQYGGFSACNINAVTKSGTNEWHGSFFYDYGEDGFRGDSLEGDDIDVARFDEKRYNATLGGAIIADKLFFFAAYEKLEGVATFDRGPAGSNAAIEVQGVSQKQLDEIVRISNEVYGYHPGGLPTSLQEEDEKLLVKFDWNISDFHRAAFTYNYNDGFSIAQSDDDPDELELSNHYYERGAELNSYVGQLFSDWSDIFSTELKIGYTELDNRQLSLGGTDFGEVQITTYNDHDNDGSESRATVYLGADDSRHANKLSYENLTFKLAGKLLLGEHNLTAGFEHENFDVYNLFIQEAAGEYRFDSIENFEAGIANLITYENAANTNNVLDAAAEFGYSINTLYVQDEYTFANVDLTVVAGLRYDRYSSDDKPVKNTEVLASYGFSNQHTVDGLDLLQPRLGLSWNVNDNLEVHGGVGLYSGGNPNVWISNNFSNNGVLQIEAQDRSGTPLFDIDWTDDGNPIYEVPQTLYDQVAKGDGSLGGVNLMDPDFEVPSTWKYAIGSSYEFENGYLMSVDYLYSNYQDAAIIRDISLEQVATTSDGRPIYDSANGRSQDFMLTNVDGDSGYSSVLSLGLSKAFDFGLNVAIGYAFTEAEDVNPMTSSVAYSNYTKITTADAQNPGTATSNYVVPHRFTLKLDYIQEFFAGYETRFTLFGSANEGIPYSYTFADSNFGDAGWGRGLLYVPTDSGDTNVVFTDNFDTEAFFAWANSEDLASGTMQRNSLDSDWWTKFNFRIDQELPGWRAEDRVNAYFIIENLGNLLNDEWGVMYEGGFPRYQAAVTADIDEQGRYVFEEFLDPAGQTRVTDASLWSARMGIRYEF